MSIFIDRVPVFEKEENDLARLGPIDEEVVGKRVTGNTGLVPMFTI